MKHEPYLFPAGGRAVLGLALIIIGLTAGRLSASSNEPILVAKYDFESSKQLGGWSSESDGVDRPLLKVIPGLHVEPDKTSAHSEQASLRLELTPEIKNFSYVYTGPIETLQTDKLRRLRLTAYVKTQGVTGTPFFSVLEHGNTKVLGWAGGKCALVSLPVSEDWQKVQTEVALNPQTVSFIVMIHFDEGTLWLDDLSAELLTESAQMEAIPPTGK